MAALRFVNVSDEDISQFLEKNGKKNLSRGSVVQDLSRGKETEWPRGTDTAAAGLNFLLFLVCICIHYY